MNEQWKQIRGHDNYEVSNLGRVRNVTTGKILKPYNDQRGYLRVDLSRDNRAKVHRLVAMAFVPQPRRKNIVNHINRDRHDNRACNLEWVTQKENVAHYRALDAIKRFAEEERNATGNALPY